VSTGDSVPFFERLAIPSSFSPAFGERLSNPLFQDLDPFTGFGGDEEERAEIFLDLLSGSGPVRLTQPVGFRRDDDRGDAQVVEVIPKFEIVVGSKYFRIDQLHRQVGRMFSEKSPGELAPGGPGLPGRFSKTEARQVRRDPSLSRIIEIDTLRSPRALRRPGGRDADQPVQECGLPHVAPPAERDRRSQPIGPVFRPVHGGEKCAGAIFEVLGGLDGGSLQRRSNPKSEYRNPKQI